MNGRKAKLLRGITGFQPNAPRTCRGQVTRKRVRELIAGRLVEREVVRVTKYNDASTPRSVYQGLKKLVRNVPDLDVRSAAAAATR